MPVVVATHGPRNHRPYESSGAYAADRAGRAGRAGRVGRAGRAGRANSTIHCLDFERLLDDVGPGAQDVPFVDPPDDRESNADDNMAFDGRDQRRLHDVVCRLPARVMVVIKETPAIRGLYGDDHWHVQEAPKTYMWTIKSRNDREATHLSITNYLSVEIPLRATYGRPAGRMRCADR